jgi:hypothetical protein
VWRSQANARLHQQRQPDGQQKRFSEHLSILPYERHRDPAAAMRLGVCGDPSSILVKFSQK